MWRERYDRATFETKLLMFIVGIGGTPCTRTQPNLPDDDHNDLCGETTSRTDFERMKLLNSLLA